MGDTLINLKIPAATAEKMSEPQPGKAPRYPWGLELNLDNDTLEKLEVDKLPTVGTVLEFDARAKVTRISENSDSTSGGKKSRTLSLQITDMAFEAPEPDPAGKLYGKGGKG